MGMELATPILGAAITVINGLVLVILSDIKSRQKEILKAQDDIWNRLYGHYHEIDCGNKECQKLHTGNVVVPQQR